MLDWRNIVKDSGAFLRAQEARGVSSEKAQETFAKIEKLSKQRSEKTMYVDELKAERNKSAQAVGQLMKEGKKDEAQALIAKGKELGEKIEKLGAEAKEVEAGFTKILEVLPNFPHESVPVGKDENDNKEVRRWGETRVFDFVPKEHDELGEALGGMDFKRATKISGTRFTFLRGPLAQMERALANLMLDIHRSTGFQELMTPYLVNGDTMYGMGQLPKFEEDLFKVTGAGEDEKSAANRKYLIPTAEVPLTSFFAGEIMQEDQLPQKFMAFSPCFRSEAGSYGRDTKGYIRQHQFNKVEMVKFSHPDNSFEELESMVASAEEVLKQLKIPFRTMLLCSGDMGFSSTKTYDLEVWLPGSSVDTQGYESKEGEEAPKGAFREISSCSNCGDFQARRAQIRFKPKQGKGNQLIHTLNGSGLAVGRTLVAVMENYQQADGSIEVPEVLQPYMGGLKKIEKLS